MRNHGSVSQWSESGTAHDRVLILSDDPESACLWALGISQQSVPTIAMALDDEATKTYPYGAFSLVLLDMNHCLDKATSVCRSMRNVFDGPMLLMTHMNDERFHLNAYDAGIDESISKPIGLHLMIAKTEAWLRAATRFAAAKKDLLEIDNLRLDIVRRLLETPDGVTSHLSVRESELLAQLIRHRGRTVRSDVLIDSIWTGEEHTASPLLRNLVYRVRQKIEPDPGRPKYLTTVPGQGYRIRANE